MKGSLRIQAVRLGLLVLLLVTGCRGEVTGSPAALPANPFHASPTLPPASAQSGTATKVAPPQFTPTSSAPATLEPTRAASSTPTPTRDPYLGYTIPFLRQRSYGAGGLWSGAQLAENSYFNRWEFSYTSDGLLIHGFANLPQGQGPFPVVIALHGYIDPAIYQTLDYTTRYADSLARAGFLVLHPNLRGYPPSDKGDNLFRVGMAIDALNLIALVEQRGGQPGLLQQADPQRIALWGHSMGGGIATRVLAVRSDLRGAVLYGPMSGDEAQNFSAIYAWYAGELGGPELSVPEIYLEQISPVNFYADITTPISLHHGREDQVVPLRWSRATCDALSALGKEVECFYYEGMPHTFEGEGDALFEARVIEFYRRVFAQP